MLVNHRVCAAFDKQRLLADAVGFLPWTYELQTGILAFADRFQWQAEVLGTESEASGTWLWAWANEASSIPLEQQRASRKLRMLGEERGISELTEPVVSLNQTDGHTLASIAIGEGLGNAYYRAPYEGGTVFLLITDEEMQLGVVDPLHRILTVFPQALAVIELLNHRDAMRGYLEHYGFHPEQDGGALVLRQNGQELLRAEFDELGRLQEMRGKLERI